MKIDLSDWLPVAAVVATIVFGVLTAKRNAKQDTQNAVSQLTTIGVKLDNIAISLAELKGDINNLKGDMKDITERLVIVEQSCKTAHKRIDEILKGV